MSWEWKGEVVVAEPIKAWRAWHVDPTGSLIATAQHYVWKEGQNTCTCVKTDISVIKSHHIPPEIDCACGFWALKTQDDVFNYFNAEIVVGEIEMWGKIVEAENGYRAEHARIIRLFLPSRYSPFKERLQERYKVDIKIIADQQLEKAVESIEITKKRIKIQAFILFGLCTYNFALAATISNGWFSISLNISIAIIVGIVSAGLFLKTLQLKGMLKELNALKDAEN